MKTLLTFILLSSSAAFANPAKLATAEQPVCYAATYSKDHMQKHPLQTVKSMKFMFSKEEWNDADSALLNITADVKVQRLSAASEQPVYVYAPYQQTMSCQTQGETLFCGIDCDGGSGIVSWTAKGSGDQITFTNNGFVMYGGCGEDVPEEVYIQSKKGGDDIFNLKRQPDNACQVGIP